MRYINCFKILIFLITLIMTPLSFADNADRNATLRRINTLLGKINPLITLAKQQQDKQARVTFQFDALQHDIEEIQQGIEQALHRVTIEPRTVKPLVGDYLPMQNSAVINHYSTRADITT